MRWPLKSKPVSKLETPFFNRLYLSARGQGGPDSTIIWTSEIPWDNVENHVQAYNQINSRFISSSHLLVQSIGQALAKHPEMNRRVVGKRVYEFNKCNVCLAAKVPNCDDVNVIQIHEANEKSTFQIAYIVMKKQFGFLRKTAPECRDLKRFRRLPHWLFKSVFRLTDWMDRSFRLPVTGRVDRLRESAVLVNDFSSNRFPVMRGYKPSRQPGDNKPLNVTIGRPENKVVLATDGSVRDQKIVPITVRVDHRICDGFQLGQFVNTIARLLQTPEALDENANVKNELSTQKTAPNTEDQSPEQSHRRCA